MCRTFFQFVAFSSMLSGASISSWAHSAGESGEGSLPPPLAIEMRETAALASDVGDSANKTRSVIDTFKVWSSGKALSACFLDGHDKLKEFFVETSKVWTSKTSLRIDFGIAPKYAVCDVQKPSDIRISFVRSGSWSYVGTDSLRYDLNGPSLNIDYPQKRVWESLDKKELAHLILHELGHALALEHEHQSPEANCDAEFAWDKIFPYYETQLRWSKQEIEFNLRTKVRELRLRISPYDQKSIMHYYFAPWMFKRGVLSSCYVGSNFEPSTVDLAMIMETYSPQTSQDEHLQGQATLLSSILAKLKLSVEQLSRIGTTVKAALSEFNRPLNLEFALENSSEERGRGPAPDMKDCGVGSPVIPAPGAISCQVAVDGSGFALKIIPTQ